MASDISALCLPVFLFLTYYLFVQVTWTWIWPHQRVRRIPTEYSAPSLTGMSCILEYSNQRKPGSELQAWQSVEEIGDFMTFLLQSLCQLGVIIDISNSVGGPLFVLMCVAYPLLSHFLNQTHLHHGTYFTHGWGTRGLLYIEHF
jgi:hypothetical protein